MSENLRVDRYLENKAMDHIDHALGRPLDPLGETYRNYFATGSRMFDGDPNWTLVDISKGGTLIYSVTDEGRQALADHLKAVGSKDRAFVVTVEIDGVIDEWSVVARSRSKARYSRYRDLVDVFPDLTFGAFCRRSTCRLDEARRG
ncbi:conserved hypothetical protein [uncultured Pleomorphomonas sp.]|uniref:Uncharacterized protein n=1 Tax=uncultured Pleomorphomonas sp. TaxID=442121 RepID=A0A212L7I4_9HYPH|nr:hypothetical protein [uncultured Pleomorphomonas sp.]SCM73437.1 conserved hypothetical protein [uncultured Pleomorphomonas sp.]